MSMTAVTTLVFLGAALSASAQPGERAVTAEAVVAAPVSEVWAAWTSSAGARTFFAPDANIELAIYGAYELYFDPTAAPGNRGGEGNKVLAFQPEKMLTFSWNAPPSLPTVRDQRTFVVVRFEAIDAQQTRVTLHHSGWGQGGEWDKAFDYFNNAWNRFVMPLLKYRFANDPVDWNNLPDLSTLK